MKNLLSGVLNSFVENEKIELFDIGIPDEEIIDGIFSSDPKKPILLYGFSSEKTLKKISVKLAAVMARNNCIYIKLPCKLELIKDAIKELMKSSHGHTAVALQELANLQETKKRVGYIKHLDCYKEGNFEEVLKLVKEKLGWEGSSDEIISRLANFRPEKEIARSFGDKAIPGVFCDIEGTLLDWDGNFDQKIVSMLEKLETEGKTVYLWTGGDPNEISLKVKGLKWQLLSKYDFEGCLVEIIIDDLPENKLRKEYGIQAEYYIHWDPDEIWS